MITQEGNIIKLFMRRNTSWYY